MRVDGVYAWTVGAGGGAPCAAGWAVGAGGKVPGGGAQRGGRQALRATSLAIVFAFRAVPVTPRRFSNHPACSFEPPMPSG
ncbi:MAG: hypothetical protein K0S37_2342 [Microbacterium sp.]|nr:hypothetical protein [Microbacterium sp.]